MLEKNKVVVILGPTSSGKSDIAVLLAKKFNGEVISADSRQVYKGLDIGTGKITKKEMRSVPHYLLDVISPKKRFTALDFKKLAEEALKEILKKNKLPIICGGTGFYIDVLFEDKQIPEIPPNEALRKVLEEKPAKKLFEILKKLDPERAMNIDTKNPRRLIRAIEIAKKLGRVPKYEARDTRYEVLKIGIKIPDEELKRRINKRLKKRMGYGMIAEAKKLHSRGLTFKRMRELGLEYGALADFLKKKTGKKEMIERLQKEIWQYAGRQKTWFKKSKNIVWFTLSKFDGVKSEINLIENKVEEFLKN